MELFDYLKAVRHGTLPHDDFKHYSHYMTMRFLSMDVKNLEQCDVFNKYTFVPLDSKNQFRMIYKCAWNDRFSKYIKADRTKHTDAQNRLIDLLCDYWSDSTLKRSEVERLVTYRLLPVEDIVTIVRDMGMEPREATKYKRAYEEYL